MGNYDQTPYTDPKDLMEHRKANARARGLPEGSLVDILPPPSSARAQRRRPVRTAPVSYGSDGVSEKAAVLREAVGNGSLKRTYAGGRRRRKRQAVPPELFMMLKRNNES